MTTAAGSGSLSTMIQVTRSLWLDERELEESFVRASGPGRQNVNKVESDRHQA